MVVQRVLLVLLSLALATCARGQAVSYSGDSASPIPVEQVMVLPQEQLGYELLGRASTQCRQTPAWANIDDELLSDVDCNTQRLMLTLLVAAASHGGHALVGTTCRARGSEGGKQLLVCRAQVARRTALSGAADAVPAAPGVAPIRAALLDDPTTIEGFRIRVDYRPELPPRARAPRSAAEVRQLSHLPPGRRALGDIVTRCDAGCSEAAMYASVRVAAASLGAADVVGTRCVRRDEEAWECVGTAAVAEVDAMSRN